MQMSGSMPLFVGRTPTWLPETCDRCGALVWTIRPDGEVRPTGFRDVVVSPCGHRMALRDRIEYRLT